MSKDDEAWRRRRERQSYEGVVTFAVVAVVALVMLILFGGAKL